LPAAAAAAAADDDDDDDNTMLAQVTFRFLRDATLCSNIVMYILDGVSCK